MSRGVNIILQVEDDAVAGTWVTVAGQRNATFSEERETVDTTSKLSGGYKENDYGLGGWTISCDGVHVIGNAQLKRLRDDMRAAKKIKARWVEIGADEVEEGMAVITSRELEGPYDAEATYSVELVGDGKPEIVAFDTSTINLGN